MAIQSLTIAEDFLLEVDHIFVCTPAGGPVTSVLQEIGLYCSGDTARHTSQGTASNVIFFQNAYLELIWIEDKDAVNQTVVQTGLDLLTRTDWQQTKASPFGVGLRTKPGSPPPRPCASKCWAERMRPNTMIHFATDNLARMVEPVCFVIPDCIALTNRLDSTLEAHQQLISHPLGVKHLTGVKVTIASDAELTNTVSMLSGNGVITLARGLAPLLELTFDGGLQAQVLDARPALPILLKY